MGADQDSDGDMKMSSMQHEEEDIRKLLKHCEDRSLRLTQKIESSLDMDLKGKQHVAGVEVLFSKKSPGRRVEEAGLSLTRSFDR